MGGKLPAFSLPDARQKMVAKSKSRSATVATVTIPTYNVVTPTYKAIKELESLQSPTQTHPVPTPLESSGKKRGYESEKFECEGSPRGRGKVVEDTREGIRRNNAAVKMQAVVRGWLQLRRYRKMK